MTKEEQILELSKRILINSPCPQLTQDGQKIVMGEGDSNANIVFVGEAPGAEEDRLGRPFVGKSGKLLDQMLKSINLIREDVYITNIVKFRPADNRDPTLEEKLAFTPYLNLQLEIIDPEVIVTLGRHAMENFIQGKKISQIRGKIHQVGKRKIVTLYHPASALYNEGTQEEHFRDFKAISRALKGEIDFPSKEKVLKKTELEQGCFL